MGAAETVGERVRRYRRLRKLTQDALAEASEVDRRQIGRLEAGEVLEPSVETVRRLAAALKVPLRALAEPLGWWAEEEASEPDWRSGLMADDRLDESAKQFLDKAITLAFEAAERADKPRLSGRSEQFSPRQAAELRLVKARYPLVD